MKFKLSLERPGKGEQLIAEEDFANFEAAHDWARDRLDKNAEDATPILQSGDGTVRAKYVKTAGGQWYAIAAPMSQELK